MSRTMRPLLAAVFAAAVVLSGCTAEVGGAVGDAAGPAASSSPQQDAPTTSGDVTTGAEPTEPSPSGGSGDLDVRQFQAMIADGLSGVTSYEGSISADLGSATGGSTTGTMRGTVKDGKAENSEATVHAVVAERSIEVEVLTIGATTYLGGTGLLDVVPNAQGKTWVEMDPRSTNPVIGRLAVSMSSAASSSSIDSFTRFADTARSVEKIGSRTVNGEYTIGYAAELDPADFRSTAAAASAATATYYLDADNRMRRVVVEVQATGFAVVVTLDMTAYNTPVDISAPDPKTVHTG